MTFVMVERAVSTTDGDFLLVKEPEEFDISRIPSGSLNIAPTIDPRMNGGIAKEGEAVRSVKATIVDE